MAMARRTRWGSGVDTNIELASVRAVLCALNRFRASGCIKSFSPLLRWKQMTFGGAASSAITTQAYSPPPDTQTACRFKTILNCLISGSNKRSDCSIFIHQSIWPAREPCTHQNLQMPWRVRLKSRARAIVPALSARRILFRSACSTRFPAQSNPEILAAIFSFHLIQAKMSGLIPLMRKSKQY